MAGVSHFALALVLVMMTTVEMSTDAWRHGRASRLGRPLLQPLSPGGYRTYIVLLEIPAGGDKMDYAAHRAWHESFLPSKMTRDGQPRLIHSYTSAVNGFSALLTDQELKKLVAHKPGFVTAIPNYYAYLQTTRTPAFLGLGTDVQPSPLWKTANYGAGVVIGVVDTGIDTDHQALYGFDLDDPPARWNGSCDEGWCNQKLIGGKNLVHPGQPPKDETGHGTHTATTAAGNQVTGISINYAGLANGTASGMAPSAHIAVYKVCADDRCASDDILGGIDAAVTDGVDVITVSLGGHTEGSYDHSSIAIGAYGAMKHGIPLLAAGGNDGPVASSVMNDVPWLMTVAAGTLDRCIQAKLLLGVDSAGANPVLGESIGGNWHWGRRPPTVGWSSLLYAEEGDRRYCAYPDDEAYRFRDKIVICDLRNERDPRVYEINKDLDKLLNNNASGVVLIGTNLDGYTFDLVDHGPRVMQIAYDDQHRLKDYATSPMATGSIELQGTILGFTPAPVVAGFSGRGPSPFSPGILKPDIMAPGVNILAGVPLPPDTDEDYALKSGTSMATPHVAGLVALFKKYHPDWSPAAVKSALMTTADIVDNSGNPILDEHRATAASAYATGAGQVNLGRALDPGLVYDLTEKDYATYLCSILGEAALRRVSRDTSQSCSDLGSTMHQSNLNYPTIIVPLQPGPLPFILVRTVSNVSPLALDPQQQESYTLKVEMPSPVRVTVEPSTLNFTFPGEKASYFLTVSCYGSLVDGAVYEGSVTLSSGMHTVRSRMVAVVGLANPPPSTAWKII